MKNNAASSDTGAMMMDDADGASNTNQNDFSFQRPKKQKRVCIVEEDIKMTRDEIEIYNQMRDEAE